MLSLFGQKQGTHSSLQLCDEIMLVSSFIAVKMHGGHQMHFYAILLKKKKKSDENYFRMKTENKVISLTVFNSLHG